MKIDKPMVETRLFDKKKIYYSAKLFHLIVCHFLNYMTLKVVQLILILVTTYLNRVRGTLVGNLSTQPLCCSIFESQPLYLEMGLPTNLCSQDVPLWGILGRLGQFNEKSCVLIKYIVFILNINKSFFDSYRSVD